MRTTLLVLVASVALLGTGLSPVSAQTQAPDLDKLAADFIEAFDQGDATALASLYTENAVRVTVEGGTVIGRAAIEEEFAAYFAGPFKGTSMTINAGRVQVVGAETAVNEGTYEVSGIMTPDGQPAPPVKGSYVNTVMNMDGVWLIASNAGVTMASPEQ
jgi:uncharacterized protein (TIGR02246 family)